MGAVTLPRAQIDARSKSKQGRRGGGGVASLHSPGGQNGSGWAKEKTSGSGSSGTRPPTRTSPPEKQRRRPRSIARAGLPEGLIRGQSACSIRTGWPDGLRRSALNGQANDRVAHVSWTHRRRQAPRSGRGGCEGEEAEGICHAGIASHG